MPLTLSAWFPHFFAPSGAWLFLLLVPLIIFYFLKLRRSRVEVSSLALWRRVINDQRVNSPFQKFKRNILLFLQILLLSAVALAAMQPFVPGNAEDQLYLPILIDCSASMAAVDENGKSRLDLAREEIRRVVDGLLPGQQLTLIAIGATTRRLTEFTDNKPLLHQTLNDLRVEDAPGRVEDGLRLCQALSRTQPIQRVRLYTDGNLPTRPNPVTGQPEAQVDIDLSLGVDFLPTPPAGRNLGITAFNARRASVDQWNVFLRIDGSVHGSSEGDVTLTSNGEVVGEEHVIVSPGESQRLAFQVPATSASRLVATLKPQGLDSLASDNQAWLNLPPGRELVVYCPESLTVFRHALEATEGIRLEPAPGKTPTSSVFDMLISDQAEDESRESPLRLMLGVIPRDLAGSLKIEEGADEIIDWQREAPLLQHVQLKNVLISNLIKKRADLPNSDLEKQGFDLLAFGSEAPAILRKREGSRLTYYLLFHPDRSTLPYRVGFPVLIANLLKEAMQLASIGELQSVTTGVLPPIPVTPKGEYQVRFPNGTKETRTANDQGELLGIEAAQVGMYEIDSGGHALEKIGASLLNPGETSLASVDRIQFNELSVAAEEKRLQEDKPLWPKFAFVAFGLLLAEWWYFQKKPVGIPD
ncbi:BatA domain-containing protein [Planctomicrobium sp. SH664]|uniref:BatA domain-containing protein n=1 Tax=Planctomicrobium sp. SH664 TaxID=3448125 RepID=UPI003F5CAEEA